ncbi:BclA C-terminal domain-containing protein [Sporosarcina sp. YIM B06819]|uniref:BclA C-terminal domain-containing protein n=1 Tax=Sporosarcina sp. YIM B06819 TaxID=3081769 RepID=UPI00298C2E46|nr:collagen-like protein [Sporosarcina sp. YIM B06819]
MDFTNQISNRRCTTCKSSTCSCKNVCGVPRVPIGPIIATGQGVPTIPPGGTCGLCEYGYIYNLTPQTVAIEADVLFDSNGVITPGITHTLGSSQIIVSVPGDYEVTFSVSGTEPNQFALFLNGSVVPGTIYGSGAGTQQNNGQAIFTIPAGGVLTLRNHSSAAAVGLASVIGGTQANVNASIVIKLLSSI